MTKLGCFSRVTKQRTGGALAVGALILTAAMAAGQSVPVPAPESQITIPSGYQAHHSIDFGGRITNMNGSQAMYDYQVNLQSGPRVLGESFELHALPGNKRGLVDDLKAFGTGFGGDPNIMAKVDASKTRLYEFTGIFRRDRLFADYNLLANPNIPSGQTIPIGPSKAPVGALAWPQVNH